MGERTAVQPEVPIREFIAKEILFSDEGFGFGDDVSLLGEGIIDSVGVVELVGFLQSRFGVDVGQNELHTENFDSVAKLAAFVRRKQGQS